MITKVYEWEPSVSYLPKVCAVRSSSSGRHAGEATPKKSATERHAQMPRKRITVNGVRYALRNNPLRRKR